MAKLVVGKIVVAVALAGAMAACASRSFPQGEQAAQAGDWDTAVEYFRRAVQDQPDKAEYKIALERATFAAAGMHIDRGRRAEEADRLDEAVREYRKALEYDPGNRELASKAALLERTIRERIEAAQPTPEIDKLREQARQQAAEPLLSPTSREPLNMQFTNASIRDVLNAIAAASGINITYDRDFQDRAVSIKLDGVTLEEALQQIMLTNQLFYKLLNERTILVAQDNAQKRQQYEEQVIRTFFLSHADATELAQLLIGVVRVAGQAVTPQIFPNKTANTITVRASAPVVQIVERILEANDKARAEVLLDVQILEVGRERAKQYGLNLTEYALGTIFSPEVRPAGAPSGGETPSAGTGTAPSAVASPPVINANTISTGISAADFYLAVPAAILRFLESDLQTKILAKPQLRGAEGQKVSVNLGEEVPVPSTTFTPLATGGANANPLTSFTYRPLGIIVDMTPVRVTYEGDIILDLTLENSARGADVNIAGQNLPAFNSRKVSTRLRLRDGESNLIAGLLREDERRSLRGFPGIMRMPVLRQLFASNDDAIRQTDIVMLITPRIIRSHDLTARDLSPIFIGTQGNMSLGGGPPPLIGEPEPPPPGPPAAPVAPGTAPTPPGQQLPPGSGPIPGFTSPTPPGPGAPQPAPATPQPSPAAPAPTEPAQPAAAPPVPPPAPGAPPAPAGLQAAAQVVVTPPGDMRVGGGPYTIPVSVNGANRLSTLTLTITFNPSVLRVRAVQEGPLMRQGGMTPTFTQQVDPNGRIDIAITRTDDQTGVAGSGLVAALVIEPIAAGASPLALSGVGTVAGGGMAPLLFLPANVTVK
jgi:type II secretory pathway component GspD/PulD (secretin)